MSKNIGWTKKRAIVIAAAANKLYPDVIACEQREEGWPVECGGKFVYQWIVVLQEKKRNQKEST